MVVSIGGILSRFYEKRACVSSSIQFVLAFGSASIMNYLVYYGLSIGISNIGLFFTTSAVFTILSRFFLSKLLRKFGTRRLIIMTLLIAGVVYMNLAFATNIYIFLIIGAVNGFAQGITWSTLNINVMGHVQSNRRGMASATYLSSIDLGIALGAIFWGKLADISGFQAVFLGTSLCMIAGGILAFFLLDRTIRNVDTTNCASLAE